MAILPSLSFSYDTKKNFVYTAFYKAGVWRPSVSEFDPFIDKSDSMYVRTGNPNLRMERYHNVGIDIDYKSMYSFSLGYYKTIDPSSTISFMDPETFVVSNMPWNALNSESLSANISIPIMAKWVAGWTSFWGSYGINRFTEEFGRDDFLNTSFGLSSNLTFNLPKKWKLSSNVYLYQWASTEMISKPIAHTTFSATRKFLDNNLTLNLMVDDVFPMKNRTNMYSGNFESRSSSQYQFTSFTVGLSYQFGRLKKSVNIRESKSKQSGRI